MRSFRMLRQRWRAAAESQAKLGSMNPTTDRLRSSARCMQNTACYTLLSWQGFSCIIGGLLAACPRRKTLSWARDVPAPLAGEACGCESSHTPPRPLPKLHLVSRKDPAEVFPDSASTFVSPSGKTTLAGRSCRHMQHTNWRGLGKVWSHAGLNRGPYGY